MGIFNEFVNGVRPGISFDMILSAFKNMNYSSIPLSFVVVENKKCLGTVSLMVKNLKMRDLPHFYRHYMWKLIKGIKE
jgi:hypothetical protein